MFQMEKPEQKRALKESQRQCAVLSERVAQLSTQLASTQEAAAKYNKVG